MNTTPVLFGPSPAAFVLRKQSTMILIGTMNWSSTRSRGMFQCPNCQSRETYRQKASRPFLTLYFIPVVPLGGLQEFVQCGRCKNAFDPAVLVSHITHSNSTTANPNEGGASATTNPTSPAEPRTDPFEKDLLTVIALMMIEDGQVTEAEINVARKLYESIARTSITREELGRVCSQVRVRRVHLPSLLNSAAQRRTHEEKLLLVQAMFGVAGADGAITPGRLQALLQSQSTLQIDEAEFQRAVSNTAQWLNT